MMSNELQKILLEKHGEILSEYWNRDPLPKPMVFGFECEDGWFEILDKTLEKIKLYAREHFPLGFSCVQIKEKWGFLEIYLSHNDEQLHQIVSQAWHESKTTCEVCGTKENVGKTAKRWMKTICKPCFDKPHHLNKLGCGWEMLKEE